LIQAVRFGLHSLNEFACGEPRILHLASNILLNKICHGLCMRTNGQIELILYETPNLESSPLNSILIEEIINGIFTPDLPEVC